MTDSYLTNIFLDVFEVSVPVSIIVAVLLLFGSFFNKRYAAKWKYRIWIFLALWLLFPFVKFSFVKLAAGTDVLPQIVTQYFAKPESKQIQTATIEKAPYRIISVEVPKQITIPVAVRSEQGGMQMSVLDILALVWLAGSISFMTIHLLGYLHWKRLIMRHGIAVEDEQIQDIFLKLKEELHIKRLLPVIYSKKAFSPMMIGFFHPALVLPDLQHTAQEMYFILKHELVHFKRRDVFIKLLFTAANAVCWFQPLIWLMVKEASVDMEISCDELVMQGADDCMRSAYTETLLNTMHRQCKKKTGLSTQFYGGKQVMRKRFQSILSKVKKKNGRIVFIVCFLAAVVPGTIAGCTISSQSAQDTLTNKQRKEKLPEQMNGKSQSDYDKTEPSLLETGVSKGNEMEKSAEPKKMLNVTKEGLTEQKEASLIVGDGFSFYLTDGEWQQAGEQEWRAVNNSKVHIWFSLFKDQSADTLVQQLAYEGYVTKDDRLEKRMDDIINQVEIKEDGDDLWCIFYCYPLEAEEGWGRTLHVIADTFAVSKSFSGKQTADQSDRTSGTALSTKDRIEIQTIITEFSSLYFRGETEGLRNYLSDSFHEDVTAYQSDGTVSDFTIKGLYAMDENRLAGGNYIVSLEFRDSMNADTFWYLTFEFAKQKDGWKILWYGLEA